MSWLTSLALSFNNLRTKKARTLLTAFAGSIGIIGIALIISLSTGVNAYIADMERSTLSEYPLQILSSGVDITSFLSSAAAAAPQPPACPPTRTAKRTPPAAWREWSRSASSSPRWCRPDVQRPHFLKEISRQRRVHHCG